MNSNESLSISEDVLLEVGSLLETDDVTSDKANIFYRCRVPVEPGASDIVYCTGNVAILIEILLSDNITDANLEMGSDGRHDSLIKSDEKLESLVSRRILKTWKKAYSDKELKFYSLAVAVNSTENIELTVRGTTVVSADNVQSKIEEFSSYSDTSPDYLATDLMQFCSLGRDGFTEAEEILSDSRGWEYRDMYPESVDLDAEYTLIPGVGARKDDSVLAGSSIESIPEEPIRKQKSRKILSEVDYVIWALVPIAAYLLLQRVKSEHEMLWSTLALTVGIATILLSKYMYKFKKSKLVLVIDILSGVILATLGLIGLLL